MVVGTILPLIRKDHWTYRAFEFPRAQKLILALLAMAAAMFVLKDSVVLSWSLVPLGVVIFYLCFLIFPFTELAPKTLKGTSKKKKYKIIKLLISNVMQENDNYDKLLALIQERDPDLLLMVETDEKWKNEMQRESSRFPYRMEIPMDNRYGMIFYSKLELKNEQVRHLRDKEYPSIKTKLVLEGQPDIHFVGVHPPPPSPTEETYSTDRDAELLMVAKEVRDLKGPVIVAGDLNDVAWSYTTDRFLNISGLLDPRKGRGIFATFHAKYFFMRWPLDHIFCSSHFRLKKMGLLSKIGSDHFPVYSELALPLEDGPSSPAQR